MNDGEVNENEAQVNDGEVNENETQVNGEGVNENEAQVNDEEVNESAPDIMHRTTFSKLFAYFISLQRILHTFTPQLCTFFSLRALKCKVHLSSSHLNTLQRSFFLSGKSKHFQGWIMDVPAHRSAFHSAAIYISSPPRGGSRAGRFLVATGIDDRDNLLKGNMCNTVLIF